MVADAERIGRDLLARADRAAQRRAATARALLAELVLEATVEGSPAIERCLDLIADRLGPLAREVQRPLNDGLSSLVMSFGSGPAERGIAFSGHIDVVPAEGAWSVSPFALTERDGCLYGRGTCDMKGGVAGFVAGLFALGDAELLDECSLQLVLTGDEEVGSRRGLIPVLDAGLVTARRAVCGEPTGLDVFLGNRGLIWATLTVDGRGGHAGQLIHLDDPVPPALALIEALRALPLEAVDPRFDPAHPSLAITRIDAGAALGALNVVPDSVTVGIDRRLLPGEDIDAAVEALAAAAAVIGPPFRCSLNVQRRWPPYAIAADEDIAIRAREAVVYVGRPGNFGMDAAANDSSWLDQHGVRTVLVGPGAPSQAHLSDEHVSVDQLRDAVRVYARIGAGTHRELADG